MHAVATQKVLLSALMDYLGEANLHASDMRATCTHEYDTRKQSAKWYFALVVKK